MWIYMLPGPRAPKPYEYKWNPYEFAWDLGPGPKKQMRACGIWTQGATFAKNIDKNRSICKHLYLHKYILCRSRVSVAHALVPLCERTVCQKASPGDYAELHAGRIEFMTCCDLSPLYQSAHLIDTTLSSRLWRWWDAACILKWSCTIQCLAPAWLFCRN